MTFCWVGNKKNYIYILMGNKKKKNYITTNKYLKKKKKTHIDVKKGKIKRGPGQQAQHT